MNTIRAMLGADVANFNSPHLCITTIVGKKPFFWLQVFWFFPSFYRFFASFFKVYLWFFGFLVDENNYIIKL